MAVCEIWDVRGRLDHPIDYAENPAKTANPKYTEDDLQAIEFNFPIYRDGQEVRRLLWEKGNTVETVCLLSNRKPDTTVKLSVDMDDYYRIKDGKEPK